MANRQRLFATGCKFPLSEVWSRLTATGTEVVALFPIFSDFTLFDTAVARAAPGLSYGPEDGQCLSMSHFGGLRSCRRCSVAQAELVMGACAARPVP